LFKEKDKIAALEAKPRKKTEVLAEVLRISAHKKRAWGDLSGRWIAHDSVTTTGSPDLTPSFEPFRRAFIP
jgi:hypothetical protein